MAATTVCHRRWLKIRGLASGGDWISLDKFSKEKKPPIGFKPFVEARSALLHSRQCGQRCRAGRQCISNSRLVMRRAALCALHCRRTPQCASLCGSCTTRAGRCATKGATSPRLRSTARKLRVLLYSRAYSARRAIGWNRYGYLGMARAHAPTQRGGVQTTASAVNSTSVWGCSRRPGNVPSQPRMGTCSAWSDPSAGIILGLRSPGCMAADVCSVASTGLLVPCSAKIRSTRRTSIT